MRFKALSVVLLLALTTSFLNIQGVPFYQYFNNVTHNVDVGVSNHNYTTVSADLETGSFNTYIDANHNTQNSTHYLRETIKNYTTPGNTYYIEFQLIIDTNIEGLRFGDITYGERNDLDQYEYQLLHSSEYINNYTNLKVSGYFTVNYDNYNFTGFTLVINQTAVYNLVGTQFINIDLVNFKILDMSESFGNDIPSIETFQEDYLEFIPDYFDTYSHILTDITVANQGDLIVGFVDKNEFMQQYSYLYMGYKQKYTNLEIVATEDAIINDCKADFLFMNVFFDLNADKDNCGLDKTTTNYRVLLDLLQDGIVKSDLENDSYFHIQYTNEDYLDRQTQISINFNEKIQGVRTVVVGFGDTTDINDFNKVKFVFKYQDFIVGYQEEPITTLWMDNVIVMNIYNTLLTYDSMEIVFQQTETASEYITDFSLTELAFLKDTVAITPVGDNNLNNESLDLIDFDIEYGSCVAIDVGCHLKNGAIWLIMDSPLSKTLWEDYGVIFNETYNIMRTQANIIEALDNPAINVGLSSIVGLIGVLLSMMVYHAIKKIFN